MLRFLFGGQAAPEDPVKAQPFKITAATTATGGGIAILGIIGAILDQVNGLGLNLPAWGFVVVIVAAILAATISSAVDVIMRAYMQVRIGPAPAQVAHLQLGGVPVDVRQGNGRIEVEIAG